MASTTVTDVDIEHDQQKDSRNDSDDKELFQDVMSQFPFLNGYTNLVLGFKLPEGVSHDNVVSSLQDALRQLTAQIPWLGGQVKHIPDGPGRAGVMIPAAWPADAPPNDMIQSRDCIKLVPSIAQLCRADAPISMLDGTILSPWPGLPSPHGIVGVVPVARLQANFVQDGLILTLSLHHNIMDFTGIIQLMRLLSVVMNGGELSSSDVAQANRDRSRVVPLLRPSEPIKDHSHFRKPLGYVIPSLPSPPVWCYFRLTFSALSALVKLAASQSLSGTESVSENDILCAFCWQRTSIARLARSAETGVTLDTVSKFGRAIDARMAMGVPLSYMGHMIYFSATYLTYKQVVSGRLATIAQALRRDLNSVNTEWAVRSFATFLANEPDRSSLMYGGKLNPTTDMVCTSSTAGMGDAREGRTALPDFGPVLGRAKFFRRPSVTPIPGSITVLPAEGSGIPIAMCLPKQDLEVLKKDSEWRRYMRHIG